MSCLKNGKLKYICIESCYYTHKGVAVKFCQEGQTVKVSIAATYSPEFGDSFRADVENDEQRTMIFGDETNFNKYFKPVEQKEGIFIEPQKIFVQRDKFICTKVIYSEDNHSVLYTVGDIIEYSEGNNLANFMPLWQFKSLAYRIFEKEQFEEKMEAKLKKALELDSEELEWLKNKMRK